MYELVGTRTHRGVFEFEMQEKQVPGALFRMPVLGSVHEKVMAGLGRFPLRGQWLVLFLIVAASAIEAWRGAPWWLAATGWVLVLGGVALWLSQKKKPRTARLELDRVKGELRFFRVDNPPLVLSFDRVAGIERHAPEKHSEFGYLSLIVKQDSQTRPLLWLEFMSAEQAEFFPQNFATITGTEILNEAKNES